MIGPDASSERVCFVHVGAPKTGSTAIQRFLVNNTAALTGAGAYYPSAGRCSWRPGHHNIANELRGVPNFDARLGTLADFCRELDRMSPSRAILSAEDLLLGPERVEALATLRQRLAAIGYRTKAVLYVRAHDQYVESIYSEAVKHGFTTPFEQYLDDVIRYGGLTEPAVLRFEFAGLAQELAAIFNRDNVIVRGYRQGERRAWLIRDFLHALGLGRIVDEKLASSPEGNENPRLTTGDVLRRIAATIAETRRAPEVGVLCSDLLAHYREDAAVRFAPLVPDRRERIVERFAADASRLVREWDVDRSTFERGHAADMPSARRARDLFVRGERVLHGAGNVRE